MSGDPVGDEESASSLNGNTNVKAAAMDTRDFGGWPLRIPR